MAEEANPPQSDSRATAGRVHPLVVLWRMIFGTRPPKPSGPCKYCGEETTEYNTYCKDAGLPMQWRHQICYDIACGAAEERRKKREKIDLIKTAIRELEAEKHNVGALRHGAEINNESNL